jgi:dolichyl-phosphate-mannose-protein mannosyltransferase
MPLSIILLICWAALCAAAYAFLRKYKINAIDKIINYKTLTALIIAAAAIRVTAALVSNGYISDISCWKGWGQRVFSVPFYEFYSDEVFCDYPPAYLYVLYLIELIKNLFSVTWQPLYHLLIKLPPIIFDILTSLFLYNAFKERSKRIAFSASVFYLFNPLVILNSSVWGQIDSVMAFFLLVSLYMLYKERYVKSAGLLAVAILVKPQALLFAPFYLLEYLYRLGTDRKKYTKLFLLCVLSFFVTFSVIILPFVIKKQPFFIAELFINTLSSYPYASLNAFNFFALMGGNAVSVTNRFLFINYSAWGGIFIALSLVLCGYLYFKGKGKSKIFYCPALFLSMVFMFGAKMHERYLFTAIALFLAAYIIGRSKKILLISALFTVTLYINVVYVYLESQAGSYYISSSNPILVLTSVANIAILCYGVFTGFMLYAPPQKMPSLNVFLNKSKHITKIDVYIMVIITLIYSAAAFVNLGDTKAPETNFVFSPDGGGCVAAFESPVYLSSLMYYKGLGGGEIQIISSMNGTDWETAARFDAGDCFKWTREEVDVTAKYIGVSASDTSIELFEMAFYGTDKAPRKIVSEAALFDEQALVPEYPSYLNGTYFDEIYHARTAYEHLNMLPHYENTHPPLGKLIIALGIKLFGMNPFGWRFMGTLFGALMLPLIYLFAKRMFKNSLLAAFAMLLLACDFMHFVQTRIATIDTYGVFFILLMYYFMFIYYDSTAKELPFKKAAVVLLLSGISFGLGAASKWIVLYGAVGLAVLFFTGLYRRSRTSGISEVYKTLLLCLLFFAVIPLTIYFLSYIPINIAEKSQNYFTSFWNYQKHMLTYHSGVNDTHPFSSSWYQWPVMERPIWYYGAKSEYLGEGLASSIVSFGNPAVWWGGTVFMIALAAGEILKHGKTKLFILTGFLSQYLPWVFIGRTVFIYHYFASVPFIILATVYVFRIMSARFAYSKVYLSAFAAAALILFIMFYPVLSGAVVARDYIIHNLKWFPSWVLSY